MLSKFRNIIILSSGYSITICSTMIMYTLLPILYSKIRWATHAGIMIMLLTIMQVFVFWPIAANLVDKYGAKKMLFVYAWCFIWGALAWLWSYMTDQTVIISILTLCMTVFFAAGYGSRFLDVYTLRMSPAGQSGMAFWWLITFAGLWRFLWTLLQPHLVDQTYQIRAPIIMISAMILFIIVLSFIKGDVLPTTQTIIKKQHIHHHIRDSVLKLIASYKRTFSHGWIFIERCEKFPLIPLSIAFWEWIFFGSLWFIIPIYLSVHPEYVSYWFEIGVYEIISVLFAVVFGYIADRYNSIITAFLWWSGILIGIVVLYFHPTIDILIIVWIIIWLSNSLLYATGQHILSEHDEDHEDDGAYGQTRSMITNIGYMCMPVIRWLLQFMSFGFILKVFASMLSCIAMMWVIITFYVLIMKRHTLKVASNK